MTSKCNRVAARTGGEPSVRSAATPAAPRRRWKIKTVLVPVDFSEGCRAAYEFALDLAEQNDARVHLLHVVEKALPEFETFPPGRNSEQLSAKIKKELVHFAQAGGHPVVPVYPEVRVGSPSEEIVAAAGDDKVDLIIIPTRGHAGIRRLLIGSVAERVVRHAPCPVLALRNKTVDFLTVRRGTNLQQEASE